MKTPFIVSGLAIACALVVAKPSYAEAPLTNTQQTLVDRYAADFNEDLSWGLLMQNEQLIAEQRVNGLMMWRCGETGKDEHCQTAAKAMQNTEVNVPLAIALAKVAISKSTKIKNTELRADHATAFQDQIQKIETMSAANVFSRAQQ